ncbi:MAG TPA: alcohol dehydrogenase catalytic domain-containing protein [Acidimicrobiia bacterium]|nr:alcohol dehydrogenase catalytic domain-containing protein [Acidimicrobiia bacterium]
MTALPDTMRVAVYRRPGEVDVEERPVPDVGPRDVLLEVSHCGICGSDIHFVLDGWGRPGSVEGHEFAGRVVAVGDEVTGWRVGDAVVGGPSPRCGTCEYCRQGRPSLCVGRHTPGAAAHSDGAFAEYTLVPEASLRRIPDGVSLRAAALAEPLAVALHGLTRGGVRAGQRLLVTGAGPIGALSVAAARARGVTDVVVSEPHPRRRALAERLGARAVEPAELVSPASPGDVVDDAFDVALECSGHAVAMEAALGQLKRGGTLVLVGAGMKAPRLDGNRILLNELVVTGSFVYDADGFERALELLARPDFPAEVLIEPGEVPLDGLLDALVGLHDGAVAAKVLIVPRRQEEL